MLTRSERRQWQLAILLLLLVSGRAAAQQGRPTFIVHTTEGTLAPAALENLGDDWTIRLAGSPSKSIGGKEWIAIRRQGARLPPYAAAQCALLTTGDRIVLKPGAAFSMDEERLTLQPERGPEINVPRAFLSYICVHPPASVDEPEEFLGRLEKSQRPRDLVYLKGGDRIEGSLILPARGPNYGINVSGRTVDVPLEQIAVLALNSDLQARLKSKKPFIHVVTARGARLQFSALRSAAKPGTLTGKTLFGATMDIPLDEVAAMAVRNGPALYLSELAPKKYQHTPFLGLSWPLGTDAGVSGRQLRLGEDYFDKGLGMHTTSQVSYALTASQRWFEALVGLEAGAAPSARARISAFLDGKSVFTSEVAGSQAPLPLRLDIRGGRELTLRAEVSDFGDVGGRVVWADARMVGGAK